MTWTVPPTERRRSRHATRRDADVETTPTIDAALGESLSTNATPSRCRDESSNLRRGRTEIHHRELTADRPSVDAATACRRNDKTLLLLGSSCRRITLPSVPKQTDTRSVGQTVAN